MVAATNVRMPDEIHERLKAWAREENRSLNDLTVEILDQATRRWAARRALAAACRVREEVRARHGELSDSAPLLRTLREERASRG